MEKRKMARTAGSKKQKETSEPTPKKGSSFFDYLRFGESYTSLVLGIIVVIIATALLLAFVHTKSARNVNTPINEQAQNSAEISQQTSELSKKAPSNIVDSVVSILPTSTIAPTALPTATPMPKVTAKPTLQPKHIVKPKQTMKPKAIVKAKSHHVAKKIAMVKVRVKKHGNVKKIAMGYQNNKSTSQVKTVSNKNIWVVQKGESLWTIAEKKYTSGYNWVDIARANNLSNPSDIHVGDRLILPNVTPKAPTISLAPSVSSSSNNQVLNKVSQTHVSQTRNNTSSITGNTYTVAHGDNLWNIAVRAYGDGYRWVDIAKANNLTDPRMIFSGNVLTIPR